MLRPLWFIQRSSTYCMHAVPHHPTSCFVFASKIRVLISLSLTSRSTSPSSTMLYFIGLGLASEKDISVAGLEVVKKAARVYLESYTAILLVGRDELVS